MPFGAKNVPPAVAEGITKESVKKEESVDAHWIVQWSWLVEEYSDLRKTLSTSARIREEVKRDERTIKPIPETTTGFIGHLVTKPEFRLEKYGPDLPQALPLPEMYNLNTGVFKYLT